MVPDNITKDHINAAIAEIDQNGVQNGAHSSTYDLIHNGNRYPPKLVISLANKFANGEELSRETFYGGPAHPAFKLLEKEGFEIVLKNTVDKEESVKIEFANWLSKNPRSSYFNNETEKIINYLEGIQDNFEIDIFSCNANNYKDIIDNIYKTFKANPEKFYKSSGARDSGLLSAILGKKNYQKFLEEKFKNRGNSLQQKYWIFQCNPEIFDLQNALRNNAVYSWTVAAHEDNIKKGDRVIIWQTGSNAACLALGEVLTDPAEIPATNDERKFYKKESESTKELRVKMKILNDFVDNPILWNEIKDMAEFEDFNAGNQGTNFTATKEQYNKIQEMKNDNQNLEENFLKVIARFSKQDLEFYYDGMDSIVKELGIQPDDKRINFSHNSRRLNLVIGQRYAWCMYYLRKGAKYSVISNNKIDENSTPFGGNPPQPYLTDTDKVELVRSALPNIISASVKELHRSTKSGYDSNNIVFEKTVFDMDYREKLIGISRKDDYKPIPEQNNLPLNQILYGPPGTGKTFKLQNEYFDTFTVRETNLTKNQYLENIVSELTWWQVIAIILLDIKQAKVNEIHSHELLLIKAQLSNNKKVRATIWGNLQHFTDPECEYVNVADRSSNPIFYKDENSFWLVKEDLLEQYYPEAFLILEEVNNFQPNPDKFIKNYEFVTFHQSFSYEDFIEGIKPKLGEDENDIAYEIQDGIFKKLCLKADVDRDNNYAIFIDEINRGNVSAIFGELITLIEKDKRLDEENELKVKLPYSKKELGVPPNLYIFGTMNTADRSVEALDTALRRRFAFEEVMPIPELLTNIEFENFNLNEVLKVINNRIVALLDRDHTIGHSYFMGINSGNTKALRNVFQNNVIPLLQEYFYHDYDKIALILGEGFIEHKESKVKFANFKNLDHPEIDSSFELKTIENIEKAVEILLNRKDEE